MRVCLLACVRACVRACVHGYMHACVLITTVCISYCAYVICTTTFVIFSPPYTLLVPICCESVETCENAHGCLSSGDRPSCCCNYGYTLNAQNECIGECTHAELSIVGYNHTL